MFSNKSLIYKKVDFTEEEIFICGSLIAGFPRSHKRMRNDFAIIVISFCIDCLCFFLATEDLLNFTIMLENNVI